PTKCRFIKFRAISEINGLPWTSAAEIRVIQNGEEASGDYWREDIGKFSARRESTKPDAIDAFVAALSATGGLWLNGTDYVHGSSAGSPEEVASETFRNGKFWEGFLTSYRILETRKFQIGDLGTYIAVLADTNLGQMIVLMRQIEGKDSTEGHWWRRVYDAR